MSCQLFIFMWFVLSASIRAGTEYVFFARYPTLLWVSIVFFFLARDRATQVGHLSMQVTGTLLQSVTDRTLAF
jgi:hypothetical protein